MSFFLESEAAKRYAQYRPKVHSDLLNLVQPYFPTGKFKTAIDIACGTGDSMWPLAKYAESILGVDISAAMLEHARMKGLQVECCDILSLNENRKFDLLTTCMAFHWFDQVKAIKKYKALSQPNAIWLIYHFAFASHLTSAEFNQWYIEHYLMRYPSPPRHSMTGDKLLREDSEIVLVAKGEGSFDIKLDKTNLIGYLTTQSNIEKAVHDGQPYGDIESHLLHELADISIDGVFKYHYAYEVNRYVGS